MPKRTLNIIFRILWITHKAYITAFCEDIRYAWNKKIRKLPELYISKATLSQKKEDCSMKMFFCSFNKVVSPIRANKMQVRSKTVSP